MSIYVGGYQIHHIGYLVKNIDKSKSVFLALGYQVEQDMIYDEYRGVDICFMDIELSLFHLRDILQR